MTVAMSTTSRTMTTVGAVVDANARYAADFNNGTLPSPPSRQLAILTCMDARLHPEHFLGIKPGEAHVITNAGGRASDDAIRSLIVSTHLLGTRVVIVIHHTDCGMNKHTDADIHRKLQAQRVDASDIEFLCFDDLEESVRHDVRRLRESPLAEHVEVHGFVYDIVSGRLTPVDAQPSSATQR